MLNAIKCPVKLKRKPRTACKSSIEVIFRSGLGSRLWLFKKCNQEDSLRRQFYVFLAKSDGDVNDKGDETLRDGYLGRYVFN